MERRQFCHRGLRLSYIDAGGTGEPVLALHAHWMEAATFRGLAEELLPQWRLLALDQRGHGCSARAPTYTREDYLSDLAAWTDHLGLDGPFVLLGHSLGGVNAYQFAARHPERVRALIVEDIGAVVDTAAEFVRGWAGVFPTREALAERIGPRLAPYLEPEFRQTGQGWTLAFAPEDMVLSQRNLMGDHWADWLSTACPALLIRGADSRVTDPERLMEMARRRPNTRLVTLNGGHVAHVDDPTGFIRVVRAFLDDVARDHPVCR